MNINCTNNCRHQADGLCTLTELPSLSQMSNFEDDIDCPYCDRGTN